MTLPEKSFQVFLQKPLFLCVQALQTEQLTKLFDEVQSFGVGIANATPTALDLPRQLQSLCTTALLSLHTDQGRNDCQTVDVTAICTRLLYRPRDLKCYPHYVGRICSYTSALTFCCSWACHACVGLRVLLPMSMH